MTTPKKHLVFGKSGQLAQAFKQLLPDAIFYSSAEADFCDTQKVIEVLNREKPDVVINASAYTAVDKAESESEKAFLVNATTPAAIAEWCFASGAVFVHYSTDYVFDGTSGSGPHGAWREDDPTGPLGVYGASKLAGEKAIITQAATSTSKAAACRYLIFRTSWVYSHVGNNFVRTMLKLGRERETLKVVSDQIGAPTYALDLARMSLKALEHAGKMATFPCGVYHLSGSEYMSWHDFAQQIFAEAHKQGVVLKVREALPIPSSEYPTPARRPLNSRLDNSKVLSTFSLTPAPKFSEIAAEIVKSLL